MEKENLFKNLKKADAILFSCNGWQCNTCPMENKDKTCVMNDLHAMIEEALSRPIKPVCSECGKELS